MAGNDGEHRLGVLDHMEHETVRVYDATLQKVTDADVKRQLSQFRDDHARHAGELDDIASRTGASTGEPSQQFHAFIEEHLNVISSARGQDEALEGLLLIEEANLGECRRTSKESANAAASDVLSRMLDEEQRDIDYIAKHMRQAVGISNAAAKASSGKGAWQMSDQELTVMLSGLRFLDEQSAIALDSGAAKAGSSQDVQAQLQQFAEDHRRHVRHIDEILAAKGGAQLPTEELQQYLHEAVAGVDRAKDVDDAIDRLLLLERSNAAEYESISRAQIDDEKAMRLLEQQHLDEQHHVSWIEAHSRVGAGYGTTSAPRIGEDPRGIGV